MKKLLALVSAVLNWWVKRATLSSSSLLSNQAIVLGVLVLCLFKPGKDHIKNVDLTELGIWGALLLVLIGRPLLAAGWEQAGMHGRGRHERMWVPLVAAKLMYAALELKLELGYAVVGIVVGLVISYAYLLYREREIEG